MTRNSPVLNLCFRPKPLSRCPPKQRGAVLIIALLMIALIQIIILSIVQSSRMNIRVGQQILTQANHQLLFEAGKIWAIEQVKSVMQLAKNEATYTLPKTQFGESTIEIHLTDIQGKINLNTFSNIKFAHLKGALQYGNVNLDISPLVSRYQNYMVTRQSHIASPSANTAPNLDLNQNLNQNPNQSSNPNANIMNSFLIGNSEILNFISISELFDLSSLNNKELDLVYNVFTCVSGNYPININQVGFVALLYNMPALGIEGAKGLIQRRDELGGFNNLESLQNDEVVRQHTMSLASFTTLSQYYLAEITVGDKYGNMNTLYCLIKGLPNRQKPDEPDATVLWSSYGTY